MEQQSKHELTGTKQPTLNRTGNLPSVIRAMELTTAAPKIRVMPVSLIDPAWRPVADELRGISSVTLGISDPLTAEENQELRRFLKAKFQDFNACEIRAAFDMYCSRELDLNYEKIGHYNKMSADFVGLVLSAYREWRSAKMKAYVPPKIEEQKPDDRTYYEQHFFPRYQQMQQDGAYPFSEQEGMLLYNDLWQLIEADYTDEEIKGYKIAAAGRVKRKPIKSAWDKPEPEQDYKERVRDYAKHLAFKDWIQSKALNGDDLRGEIFRILKP